MYSVETDAEIAQLRAIAQTRKLTDVEQKRALELIRGDRTSAAYASAASKAKNTPKPEDVMEKLKGLLAKKEGSV